jgi:hypothetical protein
MNNQGRKQRLVLAQVSPTHHKKLKERAAREGRKMYEVTGEAIDRYLKDDNRK